MKKVDKMVRSFMKNARCKDRHVPLYVVVRIFSVFAKLCLGTKKMNLRSNNFIQRKSRLVTRKDILQVQDKFHCDYMAVQLKLRTWGYLLVYLSPSEFRQNDCFENDINENKNSICISMLKSQMLFLFFGNKHFWKSV